MSVIDHGRHGRVGTTNFGAGEWGTSGSWAIAVY